MLLAKKANRGILEFFTGIFIFATMAFGGMGSAFAACESNQIDINGDGTQCLNGKFAIKTTNLNDNDEFKFTMTAAGTFTVDCGADGTLTSTANDITDGNTITRSDTTIATYTCTYTTGGVKTIAFDGTATNYSTAYQDSQNRYYAAIAFSGTNNDVSTESLTPTKIASVSGNLSSIFPYISGNNASGAQPRFYRLFGGAKNLTTVPDTLFADYTKGATQMFTSTFNGCTGLTSIPSNLFSGITTGAAHMFNSTFYNCTGLTSIPENLFFPNATSVTGQTYMFYNTFAGCTGLTSIPSGLFSGITTGAAYMFYATFNGCTNLSGYIPPSTFAGLIANGHPTADGMWADAFTNTQVATSCPAGTVQYMTGYEGTGTTTWDGKVSCTDVQTVTYSCGNATGTPPANSAVVTGSTFVPAENTCSKPGYVFYGWGVSGTNDTVIKPFTWNYSGNKTLTAQWELGRFNLTTTNLSDGDVFKFTMTAQGTFTVDCGTDGTLTSSANDITDGNTITRSDTTIATYTCTYSTGGVKTIAFDGTATNYSSAYQDSNNNYYAAIAFSGINKDVSTEPLTPTKIASVSGNLSAIFPYISGNSASGAQPRFYRLFSTATNLTTVPDTLFADYTKGAEKMFHYTFAICTGLTSIPAGLFSGIKTGASYMFYITFHNCTGLTSIPAGLFSGITTGADYMFYSTFYGCTGLTSIPADLFSGITTGALNMFYATFHSCTGLTSIPAGLFSGITTGASYMFRSTFNSCTGLTSIPADLFSGIKTGAAHMFNSTFYNCTGLTSIPENLFFPNATSVTGQTYMFYNTFAGCTGLTSIPADLFSGITTGAVQMFYQTFNNCTNLSGYIPSTTFAGLIANGHPTATDMWADTFYNTKLATSCPAGTVQYMTGYEGTGSTTWDGKVSCVPDSENTTSTVTYSCGDGTGTAPANQAAVSGETFIPAQNTCSKPGYVFYGWGVSGTNDTVLKPFTWNYSGNKTLTAQWELGRFNLTTTNLNANDEFKFTMTAAGTFTVDCGADGTLTSSANDITNGNTITRSDTTIATYTCTYSTGGVKTIAFDGTATNYSSAYQDSNNNYYAAIAFSGINKDVSTEPLTPTKIASVSGNLSSIFPYISGNSASGAQPRFYRLFNGATNITTVPDTLFADYTKGAEKMFHYTFAICTGLQSIPAGLFSGITTGASYMFYSTFSGCTDLTSIPAGLFSGIKTGATSMFVATFYGCTGLTSIPENLFFPNATSVTGQVSMFYATFQGCTGLTSIPAGLFSKITTGANTMFQYTFFGCRGLTSIPENLFFPNATSVMGVQYMFYNTFYSCTGLTSIPASLFSKITTGAQGLFYYTFQGCTGLTSIPAGLFSGIKTGASYMFAGTFDGCTKLTSIPEALFSKVTTGADNMFYATFRKCTNLSGYIPPSTFAGLIANGHPTATDMWDDAFSNTKLATSCPAGTVQYMTGYEGTGTTTWNGKVSCVSDSENTTNTVTYSCGDATGTPPANSAVVTGSTFVPAQNTCSKPGYVFYGWGVSGTNDTVIKPFTWNYSGNKTLTAQWGLGKFNLTTTNLNANDEFKFTMTAAGTFTVDCGTDGTLTSSANDITDGNTITRSDTTIATYTCTYSTGGVKTIAFDGLATNYSTAYQDSSHYYAAIAFSGINSNVSTEPLTPTKIASVSGNLSAIFPYISGNAASGAQPRFYRLFNGATNITTVPDTLFADYTKGASYMFHAVFSSCTGLQSIPADLFSGITTGASNMFRSTFYGCTGLTSIPAGLFSGITTGAEYMFASTFNGCTGLTSIPAGLFSGITTGATNMFNSTFAYCTGLTSIPAGLFSGITTGANWMFTSTFYGCTGLTSIPAGLFSSITTGATYMFYQTFYGCTNLSGYIPPSTFAGLIAKGSPTATDMWADAFSKTKLATSCPAGTVQYMTGYEGTGNTTWNGKVSCVEYPNQLCSPGEYLPNTASVCQPCTENSYCTGGTFTVNTAGAQGIDMCPNDWYSPAGMSSVDQCGRILHIGDNVVYLRSAKKTTPSLHIKVGDDVFYGNATTLDVPVHAGVERKLKVRYNNTTYSIYDDSVELPNQ